jgi:hypothetical protein
MVSAPFWRQRPTCADVPRRLAQAHGRRKGTCQRARNSSIEQDVLYFVFPNSAFAASELNVETINTKVKERAFGLYNKLRGAS